MTTTEALTIPQAAARAGWSRRRMYRFLPPAESYGVRRRIEPPDQNARRHMSVIRACPECGGTDQASTLRALEPLVEAYEARRLARVGREREEREKVSQERRAMGDRESERLRVKLWG